MKIISKLDFRSLIAGMILGVALVQFTSVSQASSEQSDNDEVLRKLAELKTLAQTAIIKTQENKTDLNTLLYQQYEQGRRMVEWTEASDLVPDLEGVDERLMVRRRELLKEAHRDLELTRLMYGQSGTPYIGRQLVPFLGLDIRSADGKLLVDRIHENSPASRVDIKPLDAIVKVDGYEMRSAQDVRELLAFRNAGELLPLTILRDGETIEVSVRLSLPPEELVTHGNVVENRFPRRPGQNPARPSSSASTEGSEDY
ncbi:MAG: PDZ domain-containing protein [Planctomycetes bacterium]|nr:PDZ domain-containing protein [Planctomycetota bacterium]